MHLDVIDAAPRIGEGLVDLLKKGKTLDHLLIASGDRQERQPFFHADPVDVDIAKFGHLMLAPGFRRYQTNDIVAYKLPWVTVLGGDAVLLQGDAVLPDSLFHLPYWAPGSVVESFTPRHVVKLRRPVPVSRHIQGEGFFIGFTAPWKNYAHWMQECMPRLVSFLALRTHAPGLRIVLPRFEPNSFQEQTVRLLGITPAEIFEVAEGEAVQFAAAYVLSPVDIWTVPGLVGAAARWLAAAVPAGKGMGPRIYLHRETQGRTVANFGQVRQLVEHYGFRVASFETAPVAEQIVVMREARHVIAEHGAGLANTMFCLPGAHVLEMFNPACVQPEFWSVASVCDLAFGYLVGDHAPTAARPQPDWNSGYAVPLDRLEQAIRTMLGNPADHLPAPAAIVAPPPPATQPVPRSPMSAAPRFLSASVFAIGELTFALAGGHDAAGPERIRLLRDRGFVDAYADILPPLKATRAFEFGNDLDGNALFLTALLDLDRYVCLYRAGSSPAYAAMLERHALGARIRPHFGNAQDDGERIAAVLQAEFGAEPPDLIVDAASHLYEPTKRAFQIAFPYLKDGGHYIIENWSWAHWPENQKAENGWINLPAMSNLILELALLLPSSDMIESITIRQAFVIIRKKRGPAGRQPLDIDSALRLRGKMLGKI